MSEIDHSVATLRIYGDALQPEIISRMLGCEPTHAQSKGDTLIGKRSGTERIARTGMWRLCASDREPEALEAQIEELLGKLADDLSCVVGNIGSVRN